MKSTIGNLPPGSEVLCVLSISSMWCTNTGGSAWSSILHFAGARSVAGDLVLGSVRPPIDNGAYKIIAAVRLYACWHSSVASPHFFPSLDVLIGSWRAFDSFVSYVCSFPHS